MTASLRDAVADYLAVRRALGYRLARPEKLLAQFLDHLDQCGQSRITVAAALDWARQPAQASPNWWAYRLSVVRGFATWVHTLDPVHEVPATDLLARRPQRATPYLYSEADIAALIRATATLRTPLRRATYATLIGLLSVTGMRVGEAINLDRADVDLHHGRLLVRNAKFGKDRELLLHPTSVSALSDYLRARSLSAAASDCPAFLVSATGTRLLYCNVASTFHRLVGLAALPARPGTARPRIHDLRHTFAVTAMLEAYAAGQDGQARLTLISTWLGHVNPASTYWYLSACPELMVQAAARLDTYLADRP